MNSACHNLKHFMAMGDLAWNINIPRPLGANHLKRREALDRNVDDDLYQQRPICNSGPNSSKISTIKYFLRPISPLSHARVPLIPT